MGLDHNPAGNPGVAMNESDTGRMVSGFTKDMTVAPAPAAPTALPSFNFETPKADPALPSPPAGYMPGPTSVSSMLHEDSALYKIGTTLASYGEKIPVHMQLKMAEQELTNARDKNKLAWDNYYANMSSMRDLQQKHNRDAAVAMVELFPHIQDQIGRQVDPTSRQALIDHFSKQAESLQKGGGDLVQLFGKNISSFIDGQELLTDPDTRDEAMAGVASMGIYNWMNSPGRVKVSLSRNTDRFAAAAMSLPADVSAKLATTRMNESEFRVAYKEHLFDLISQKKMTPGGMESAVHHLDTERGQQQMHGIGVNVDAFGYAKDLKNKTGSAKEQEQSALITNSKAIKEFVAKYPDQTVFSQQQVDEAKTNYDTLMGLRDKPKAPGEFSQNNPLASALLSVSGGKWSDPREMLASAAIGTPEHTKLLGWLDRAMEKAKTLGYQAAQDVKLSQPADLTNVYDANILRNEGRLSSARGQRVSQDELLTSPNLIKMTDKQVGEFNAWQGVKAQYQNISEKAMKAYDPKRNQTGLLAAEWALTKAAQHPEDLSAQAVAAKLKPQYEDLTGYISNREAVLGQFARKVSGEVGVLTDQDVGRVRNLFGTSGDTPKILAAKHKALGKLLDLNERFMKAALVGGGSVDLARTEDLRHQKQYWDAKEGILGSVENFGSTPEAKTGVNSLLEDLRKGK